MHLRPRWPAAVSSTAISTTIACCACTRLASDEQHQLRVVVKSLRYAGEFFPGTACESDAQLTEYIRESISTWFHPVGTCRMGVGDDAVVDPTLAVLGTTGLHVADASIMPDIVSVNTNAASMMIGWRAADFLL